MKKTDLFLMAVAAMAGMTSCSNEEVVAPATGGDGNVNFTVSLPGSGFATRAFADGMSAEHLQMAVYDAENDNLVMIPEEVQFNSGLSTQVSLNLAAGRNYKIAFFANPQAGDGNVYTFSAVGKTVTVDYKKMTDYNSTDYDCFYALYETGVVSAPINDNVTLTRPVAQVNWGTSDLEEGVVVDDNAYGASAAKLVTKVTAKAYSTFDLLSGDVKGDVEEVDVTMPYSARPDATKETFPVESETYKYLSMHYLLVPKANSVVDLTLYAHNEDSDATPAMSTVTVTNAPVQANYRTNIYGALLTNPAEFTVTKDKNFTEPDNNIKVVRTAAALADALTEGGEIEVPEDVELDLQTVNGGQEIELADNTVLTIKGAVNTARAQLAVKEGTVTVDGEGVGKITSVGFATASRPLNVYDDATLIVKNISVETEQNNGGSAIYSEGGNIELESVTVDCHNFAVAANGGTLKAKKCIFNSDSNNKIGAHSYTIDVTKGCVAELNDCEVNGIQGGISVGNENSIVTINGGTYTTRPLEGYTDQTAFYPVYIFDKGVAVINSGDFISGCEYTIFNGNNDVPELYTWGNGACLKGGRYNKGTIDQENKLAYPAAEGYKWEAIDGDDTFKWKVVPKEESGTNSNNLK
ncbi:MAG: hypothetical protein Q4C37_09215 [Bacteroidales bacterium]|nr:hypothetical protein [Bacteroidales bacterium]